MTKEKVKILIATPTSGRVESETSYSITSLVAFLAGGGVRSRIGAEISASLLLLKSSVIHSNREVLASFGATGKNQLTPEEQLSITTMNSDITHVLFIDDDMIFAPQAVDLLLSRRHPIVGVNYCFKKFPIEFVAVATDGSHRVVTNEHTTGLQEVAYTGFGLCLIETKVFRGTPKPWFLPEYVPSLDTYTTEDNPFFRRARESGFPCLIDHDASKLVAHLGSYAFKWDSMKELLPKDS